MSTWRLQLYWQGRREDDGRHAEMAMAFAQGLTAAYGADGLAWRAGPRALELPGDWRAAFADGAVSWRCGERTVTSYVVELVAECAGEEALRCRLTLGVRAEELAGMFLPDQVRVVVAGDAGEPAPVIGVLWAALLSAVAAFDPDWGHAGTELTPAEAMPMFDDGAPVPGWWTYLSTRVGRELTLPPVAQAHAVGDRGVLVVAHEGLFNAREEAHARAVDEVRAAMEAAGLLTVREEGE